MIIAVARSALAGSVATTSTARWTDGDDTGSTIIARVPSVSTGRRAPRSLAPPLLLRTQVVRIEHVAPLRFARRHRAGCSRDADMIAMSTRRTAWREARVLGFRQTHCFVLHDPRAQLTRRTCDALRFFSTRNG